MWLSRKRYAQEIGTPTVEALFTQLPLSQMRIIVLGCTETYAILVRKRNRGDISAPRMPLPLPLCSRNCLRVKETVRENIS